MSDAILVINAGSSSIKFSLYRNGGTPVLSSKGQIEGIAVAPHFQACGPNGTQLAERRWTDPALSHRELFRHLLDWIESHLDGSTLTVAGHRVVHGGTRYSAPMVVTPEVLAELTTLIPLAPLHQPHNLAPIRALAELHPGLAQVACFDTAFHRTNPAVVQTYGLPRELTDEGIRRYGFHGLSYDYIAHRLTEIAPELAKKRVAVAHLGSGASMCAIKNGASVTSTMGFSTLDGLVMGTRTGALDPGVVLYLMQSKGYGAKEIETLLYKRSGLLGVSGISNDMRILMDSDDPRAAEAVDLFIHRIARETGSLAAAMEGLDAFVFTAGIGEHSPPLRSRICNSLAWMGIALDEGANQADQTRISRADSPVAVFVIPTDEEAMIARHSCRAIQKTL